jgi:uncharacterized protein YjiS (DUF1127 family)
LELFLIRRNLAPDQKRPNVLTITSFLPLKGSIIGVTQRREAKMIAASGNIWRELATRIGIWHKQSRALRDLESLSDDLLRDIGQRVRCRTR